MRILLAAFLAVAAITVMGLVSAHGQTTVDELVVTAPNAPGEKAGEQKQVFAYKLSYADLDLKTATGQSALRHRIRLTAKYVCDRLAATDNKPYTVTDCRRKAIDGAEAQAARAISAAEARQGPFHRGPPWQPPPGASAR
jgi:UrcA family protein